MKHCQIKIKRDCALLLVLAALTLACGKKGGPEAASWIDTVRPDHPRLFLNRDILPEVKALTRNEEHEFYEKFKFRVDEWAQSDSVEGDFGSQAADAAFVYLMSGERRYLELSRTMLHRSISYYHRCFAEKRSVDWYVFSRVDAWAALDWIWNDLPVQERNELTASYLRAVLDVLPTGDYTGNREPFERENWGWVNSGFYGTAALAWYAGLTALGEGVDDTLARRLTLQGYDLYTQVLEYRSRMAGDDGGSASAALNYALVAYPWAEFNFFHTVESATGENLAPRWPYVGLLPGYLMWNLLPGERSFGWGDSYHETNKLRLNQMDMHLWQIIHFYGDGMPREMAFTRWLQDRTPRDDRISFPWARFLIRRRHPELVPAGPDQVLPQARMFEHMGQVFFRSGSGESDTYATFTAGGSLEQHKHFDHNNFNIYHKGFLALDTGTRPEPGQHLTHYYCRSVAHNCILVRMPGEEMPRYWGSPAPDETVLPYPNDGGQCKAETGSTVVAFETGERFSYVAGDATGAYDSRKCGLALRQFVFLPPDFFVVFDRVESRDKSYPKTWLLHAATEPVIQGDTFHADHESGRLFCRTLLPKDATLGKIGGPGKQFWSDGRNWPLPAAWRAPDTTALLGQWRVEVAPGAPRESDLFLHLIQVGDRDSLKTMVSSELLQEPGYSGVRFVSGNRRWQVLFAESGAPSGRIKLEENGKVVLERELSRAVQPQSGLFGN